MSLNTGSIRQPTGGGGTFESGSSKTKRQYHRMTVLTNYRLNVTPRFFVGAILGLDIWKYYRSRITANTPGRDNQNILESTSNQFLWNKITGQLAAEAGFRATSHFLFKLEAGYDLFGLNKVKNKDKDGEETEQEGNIKFNGFYIALGVGYSFG